jgi:hypothetical protein
MNSFALLAQNPENYWQQHAEYIMNVNFDVNNHQFAGTQKLVYTNNSPDTLRKVYYHLYYNAFAPGSMMDVRSRTIADPDARVKDRISKLKPNEIGYQNIKKLTQNGKKTTFKIVETILEVQLDAPILPKTEVVFEMEFEAQVPVQIRRTGRNNAEGVAYSMTQWYPKMCEYDHDGWAANPYIAREFHGVWGDFDVTINIDKKYTLAATGYLKNPQAIGKGYENTAMPMTLPKGNQLSWHFVAPQVHDFAWAADTAYRHTQQRVEGEDLMLHFFNINKPEWNKNWDTLAVYMTESFKFANKNFGKYPYKQYSFIQGGDGGMEYPMATLILGGGTQEGLVGVSVHESMHSWYQGLLATNESKYAWMDEGFTSYAENKIIQHLYKKHDPNPHEGEYAGYFSIVKNNQQEPITTHADFYKLNRTYSISSYGKGAILLHQLSYIVGQQAFDKALQNYYYQWRFKHPTDRDFKRVFEKTCNMELDWYFEQFVNTTNTIDYGIKYIGNDKNTTTFTLERIGDMPMPVDVHLTLKNGTKELYHIPLSLTFGTKNEKFDGKIIEKEAWQWVYPQYRLSITHSLNDIESIEIDATTRMADVNRDNNIFPQKPKKLIEWISK